MYLLIFSHWRFLETLATRWWQHLGPGEIWQVDERDATVLHRRAELPSWSETWGRQARGEWLIHGQRRAGGAGPSEPASLHQPADPGGVVRRITDLSERYQWALVRWDDYFGFESVALVTRDGALAARVLEQYAAGTDLSWNQCVAETQAGRLTNVDALVHVVESDVAPSFHAVAFLEEVDDPGRKVLDIALPQDELPLALYWMLAADDDWLSITSWGEIACDRVRGPFRVGVLSSEAFGLYRPCGREAALQMCGHKHRSPPREFTIFSPRADPQQIERCYERNLTEDELHPTDARYLHYWHDLRWTLRFLEVADWAYRLNSGCAPDVGVSLFCARDPQLVARVADGLQGGDWRSGHSFALY